MLKDGKREDYGKFSKNNVDESEKMGFMKGEEPEGGRGKKLRRDDKK